MFTGIIESVATLLQLEDRADLRRIRLHLGKKFSRGLKLGASVSVDGVCLTVVQINDQGATDFEVIPETLHTTTLGKIRVGEELNVERASREGAEIGGHPLSGHIDFCGKIRSLLKLENHYSLQIDVPPAWINYIFSKGYIALNGASLTIHRVNKEESWFEVGLIPETLRRTTFTHKKRGDLINVEIDRHTQVIVDTVKSTLMSLLNIHASTITTSLAQKPVALLYKDAEDALKHSQHSLILPSILDEEQRQNH